MNTKIKKAVLRGASSLSAVMLLSATGAWAQEAPKSATTGAAAAAEETPEAAIVVTGSRIQSVTPYNSSDPITVVDPEMAKKEGKFDLASTLQSSPIAAGSTQVTAALSSNFVTNGGPGAQTIDLRGLGANRTLVLLNGRRAGPAGTRGGVSSFDLNVLPLSIIDDIQILKTGASSIYGSDAVAGVVNISTKKKADGFKLDLNGSLPFKSGGEEYRVSASWGKNFSRGSFVAAVDYTKISELSRGDRSYLACPEAYIFKQDGSRADLIDTRTGKPHCEDLRWGHIWTYNLIGNLRLDGPGGPNTGTNTSPGGRTVLLQYQYPGETLGIPAYGAPAFPGDFKAPAGWFPTGYDAASMAVQNAYHPFVEEQTIIPKTELITGYMQGSYELSDSVEVFGEFLANRRSTYQNGWRQIWNFGYTGDLYGTGTPNGYNYWAGGFQGVNLISPTGITNQSDSSQRVDYFRGVGGLRGDFGGARKWHWEVTAQYSKSVGRYRDQQFLQDVYNSGYFQTSSCVGKTLPKSGKKCIDLPWADPNFLAGKMTQQQIDFMFDWEEGRTVYTQLSGEATITGQPFDLPAGPLGVALGASIRRDEINDTPGAITLAGNAWGSSASGITAGRSVTSELYGELSIPVFKNAAFADEFTLSAAGRLTNVKATKTSNGASAKDNGNYTYKLGFNWTVNDWLRFRGSIGSSYRAPALFEQFLVDETSFIAQGRIDPCIQWGAKLTAGTISQRVANNCQAAGIPSTHLGTGPTATVVASGGLGVLRAETSIAKVFGTVLTPRLDFLPDTRISLAVDYFDIKVKGEISKLGASNILFGCYNSENFATEPLCTLFTRGQGTTAPFLVNKVFDKYINISSQRNRGLDVAFNVKQDLGKLGSLNFLADMTWQFQDDSQLLPGSVVQSDNGEAGSPKWVGDFRATWKTPWDLSVFYGMNVIGGTSDLGDFLRANSNNPCITSSIYGTYCPVLRASPTYYHNMSVTKDFEHGLSVTVGVNNIFDTRPPRVSVLNGGQISTLGPVIAASQYSFVGRRVFMNASVKF